MLYSMLFISELALLAFVGSGTDPISPYRYSSYSCWGGCLQKKP